MTAKRLPADPTNSWVPTPLAMMRLASPAVFAVLLALNVLTTRKGNVPGRTSSASLPRLQRMVGNRAGKRRGPLAPMRRDQLLAHLETAKSLGLLKDYSLDGKRGNTLSWSWPLQPRTMDDEKADDLEINRGLRGRGKHAMVPKAVAYDPWLSGTAKMVYAAAHYLRYLRGKGIDPLPWDADLTATMTEIAKLVGLKRKAVSSGYDELIGFGLLQVFLTPGQPSTIRIAPITASYVMLRARVGQRRHLPLYVPLRHTAYFPGGMAEWNTRLAAYEDTDSDEGFADPQYWVSPGPGPDGYPLPPLFMDQPLRDSFDYGVDAEEGCDEEQLGVRYFDDLDEDETDEHDEHDEEHDDEEVEEPEPEPELVIEPGPEPEPEPEPDLTSANGLAEEFNRRAQAIFPGRAVAHRHVRRRAYGWLGDQTPEEILAVMDLFLAGAAHELSSEAVLGQCFTAQYPDLLQKVAEQPVKIEPVESVERQIA